MDVHPPVDIGTDFLGYRIEELIGRGGMGVVYRAYDLRLKRSVAVKFVAPSLALDDRFRERFARETELVMSLEHPNVVPIYDAGDVDGRLYLAMRLVEGHDLGSLLRVEGSLEPDRAVAICAQIASALDAARARGLVHRDVKPSNVLLDAAEHVYLADFGLTRRLDDKEGETGEDRSLGTPAYLAPEQLEGRPIDGRADVYALGCVLYECLTGKPVFPRDSRLAVAWAHLEEEPPRASRQQAGLPEAIDGVITRAMAKEPEERYPTCMALTAAVEDALGLRPTHRLGRRLPLLLGAAALLATGAAASVAGVLATRGHGKTAPLLARANTLARIDPSTNRISALIRVGADPVVTAASDYTVWAYSRAGESISQVYAPTNRMVDTTRVSLPAECCSLFTGPVLAADASGAWFVEGGIAGRRALLVHVLVGSGKRQYPLPITPTGVAVGAGAVWVVGHDAREDAVLRIDPVGGRVTSKVRFPPSAGIDSIAFGYGAVWALSSEKAKLYRIDPHTAQRMTSRIVADSRATRPEIMTRGGVIFVSVTGVGGETYSINPSRLSITAMGSYGPPGHEENIGELGSLWWYDWPSGDVNRQEIAGGPTITIPVTRPLPAAGGACLTSMAQGAGSIWVTVAPSVGHTCVR
jgi:serine/threonine protein kinase